MAGVGVMDRRKHMRKQRLWSARITQGHSTWSCVSGSALGGAKVRLPGAVRLALAPAKISCVQLGEVTGSVVWQSGTNIGIKLA